MPQASISYPSGALAAGNTSRNPILQDYIFNAGLIEPSHSSWLFDIFPDYRMTVLMDKLGGFSAVADAELRNDTLTWSKLGRTRASATISSGYTNGVASDTWTLDTVATGANLGYFLAGDVLRTESGKLVRVTAVGDAGGFQTITVAKLDGTNFASGDAADTEKIGHAFSSFAPGSTGPTGRIYLPAEEYNYSQIFRRGGKIDRGAFSNRIYLKEFGVLGAAGESWMFKNEKIEIMEQMRDIENAIMFGQLSTSASGKTTRGIWDRVVTSGEGQVVNFTTATGISESDLQTVTTRLSRQNGSKELLVLCGSEAMSDIQNALKHYTVNGGVTFGAFGGNLVGLDITQYKFNGFTLNFMHYNLFDDDKLLPFVSTSTASKINFRHVALFLDLGTPGERLMSVRYRNGDIGPAKFVHKYINGMFSMDGSGVASNSFDGAEFQLLSELLVEYKGAERSGALVPNA